MKVIAGILGAIVLGTVVKIGLDSAFFAKDQAEIVLKQEFSGQELNRKYEWFKEAHAQLTQKKESIKILESNIENLETIYAKNEKDTVFQELNQSKVELNGLKMSYNTLAADYNAEMAKWHTAIANRGDVPGGSNLPKEVTPYISQ